MKSWKSLFVKSEDEDEVPQKPAPSTESFSFPVNNSTAPSQGYTSAAPQAPPAVTDPVVNEVLQVYENGLDSINMPGYDFYEFYKTVISTGNPTAQSYNMAFQMGRTLDKTITPAKLLGDAEFYISKINEVHSQYTTQGNAKLNGMQEKKSGERLGLQKEIDDAVRRVASLRAELQNLENEVSVKRSTLSKIDEGYSPQEKTVRDKLAANDLARKVSIDKLNMIKDGIQRYIK